MVTVVNIEKNLEHGFPSLCEHFVGVKKNVFCQSTPSCHDFAPCVCRLNPLYVNEQHQQLAAAAVLMEPSSLFKFIDLLLCSNATIREGGADIRLGGGVDGGV